MSGYNFSNYKFTDASWNEEFQTRKPLSPIFACICVNNSRQTTGFGPLHHKYGQTLHFNGGDIIAFICFKNEIMNSNWEPAQINVKVLTTTLHHEHYYEKTNNRIAQTWHLPPPLLHPLFRCLLPPLLLYDPQMTQSHWLPCRTSLELTADERNLWDDRKDRTNHRKERPIINHMNIDL